MKEYSSDEARRKWMDMNTEDFNLMRKFLSEIEMKIMHLPPEKQYEFYQPLKNIIFMAWEDACNPDDSFLNPKPPTP